MARPLVIALLVLLAMASNGAQSGPAPPFRETDASASARIAQLRREVEGGNARAVDAFWNEVRARGAPLVEPAPGESGRSLLTFLWRGTASTRNVVVVDGVAAGAGGV